MINYKYVPNVEYKVHLSSGGIDLLKITIYINEVQYFEPGLPNIFKAYEIDMDDFWKMPIDLFRKLMHRPPKLNEYFHVYRAQLNFAIFCASSALGISKEHLQSGNNLLKYLYQFHVYYHIRKIFHILQTQIPGKDGFNKFENSYSSSAYHKICNEYGVDPGIVWVDGTWLYDSVGVFHDDDMNSATEYTKINNDYSKFIIETSKGFTIQGLYMISESVRVYTYLILSSQASARSSIIVSTANALTAQQVFVNNFENVINRRVDIQEDIKRYQDTLNYASSKVNYSVGQGIYMLPSNMNLNIGDNVSDYNNEILIAGGNFKLGVNTKINIFLVDKRKQEVKQPIKKTHFTRVTQEKYDSVTHGEEKIA